MLWTWWRWRALKPRLKALYQNKSTSLSKFIFEARGSNLEKLLALEPIVLFSTTFKGEKLSILIMTPGSAY